MSDDQTQMIVDAVATVTRQGIGKLSYHQLDEGWHRLEGSLSEGKYPSLPVVSHAPRWWLRGFALAAAGLLLGLGTHRLMTARSVSPLHYALEGATLAPGETIQASPTEPARLTFSDNSRIGIAPSTRLSVMAVDAHGSRIVLANGEIDVSVQHHQGTSWSFDAGPFNVRVTGTAFHLGFESNRGRFLLRMSSGSVEVRGPSRDRVLTLRGGESLELFAGSNPDVATSNPVPAPGSAELKGAEASKGQSASEVPARPTVEPAPATSPDAVPAASAAPTSPRGQSSTAKRKVAMLGPMLGPTSGKVEESASPASALSGHSHPWAQWIARGDFQAVVSDAERKGLDSTLSSVDPADLISLADAARYVRRNDLARKALLILRSRFPGSERAGEAAFFLGRLAESTPGSAKSALSWYDIYLNESEQGPYVAEALGREISLLARTDRARARKAAQTYLGRFPHGSQAEQAKSLLQSMPE